MPAVYGSVLVPPAVARELGTIAAQPWVVEHGLRGPIDPRVLAARLDPGEREAIALGMKLDARAVLLDDLPARRLAERIGLPVVGTVGVLIAAKRLSLLLEVRTTLEALLATGFRIGPDVIEQALVEAGEAI